jgi:hypothetical protein
LQPFRIPHKEHQIDFISTYLTIKAMKQMIIEATKNSPMVELNPEGIMIIQGRSIIEDTISFYNPIIDWVKQCSSKKFTLEVRLEYMNTSSSKQVFTILKTIKDNFSVKDVYIKWYYEEDDEDMLDTGKDFESLIRIPIDFYEYSDHAA